MLSVFKKRIIIVTLALLGVLVLFVYFYEKYTFHQYEKRLEKQTIYLAEAFWNLDKGSLRMNLRKIMLIEGLNNASVIHRDKEIYTMIDSDLPTSVPFEEYLYKLQLVRLSPIYVPIYYNNRLLGYMRTEWLNRNFYLYMYVSIILTFLGIIIVYHLAYREREKQYRELVENANSAMVRWNKKGIVVFFNEYAEKYFGYSKNEIVGKPLVGTIFPEKETTGRDLVKVIDEISNNPEQSKSVTLENQRKDGTRAWFNWTHKKVRDSKTEEAHIFSIGSDITTQKRAEEELANAQEELVETARLAGKAEIASNVLHNVGNVLTSIKTIVDILKRKKYKLDLDNFAKALELLEDNNVDLKHFLTEDEKGKLFPEYLLRFTRLVQQEQHEAEGLLRDLTKHINTITDIIAIQQTHAKSTPVAEKTDLVKLTEDVLRIDLPSIEKNQIQVYREYDIIQPVKVDRHRVMQIVLNLIRNSLDSLKACDRKEKKLILKIHRNPPDIKIEVVDNGVGITPENREHIFTYGFTTKREGHGFGLHGSANLAKSLNAKLTFHSDGNDQGAVFSLSLPVEEE